MELSSEEGYQTFLSPARVCITASQTFCLQPASASQHLKLKSKFSLNSAKKEGVMRAKPKVLNTKPFVGLRKGQ
jgi:hypothetical protein